MRHCYSKCSPPYRPPLNLDARVSSEWPRGEIDAVFSLEGTPQEPCSQKTYQTAERDEMLPTEEALMNPKESRVPSAEELRGR